MFIYEGKDYGSKAAAIRSMFDQGLIQNNPHDKNMMAKMLGITVQTVHATLVKHIGGGMKRNPPAPVVPSVDSVTIPDFDIHDAISKRYNECYEIAKSKGYDLPFIPIRFDLKGTVAGMFCWNRRNGEEQNYFRVNLQLAKRNKEDYLRQTIPHEFCHYVVRSIDRKFGVRSSPHGREWKNMMIRIFNLDPHRCHSYDVSVVRRGPTFIYKCNCMEHSLTALKHKRFQMGTRYHCARCKSKLTFVGNK